MNQIEIIDLARAKLGLGRDQDLAEKLGIGQSAISQIRRGASNIGPELALKLAKVTDLDPREVVAATMAARCKDDEARKEWEKLTPDQFRIMCRKSRRVPLVKEGPYLKAA